MYRTRHCILVYTAILVADFGDSYNRTALPPPPSEFHTATHDLTRSSRVTLRLHPGPTAPGVQDRVQSSDPRDSQEG